MGAIYRTQKTQNFTTVSNGFINDPGLSAKAKGILLYLLSKPDGWETRVEDIVAHMADGIDSIKSGIRELSNAGYMQRSRVHAKNGRFASLQTFVFEAPLPKVENPPMDTKSGKTINGKPRNRKNPQSENPLLLNTNDQVNTDQKVKTEEECGTDAPRHLSGSSIESNEAEPTSTTPPVSGIPQPLDSPREVQRVGGDKSSAAAQKARSKRKRLTAETVYPKLLDRDSFEKAWVWYCNKCQEVGASPGDKVPAANEWHEVVELGNQLDRFRQGCRLFFASKPQSGIPHFSRFIGGSEHHPTPYWETAIELAEVQSGRASEFMLGGAEQPVEVADAIAEREREIQEEIAARIAEMAQRHRRTAS